MEYNQETFRAIREEMEPLNREHWKEINLFNKELNTDVEAYLEWDESGISRVYTAREDGILKGYAIFILFEHNHHKGVLHATQDVLYMSKDSRGRGLGFMSYCERSLKVQGVKVLHQCVPSCNDWSKILEYKKYRKLETIYVKDL